MRSPAKGKKEPVMTDATPTITDVTVPYDAHLRWNPDGSWAASFQYRRIVTLAGQVVLDQPLARQGVGPGDAGQKAALDAFMGTALAQALADNAALSSRLAAPAEA